MNALPLGGLHERRRMLCVLIPLVRPCSEAYLPEDNHVPERLLCVIVGRRYAGDAQEGKEMLLIRADKKGPQCHQPV